MQEALPYKRWEALPHSPLTPATAATHVHGGGNGGGSNNEGKIVAEILTAIKENPVIVISKRGCCMCHVVRKLLLGLGVNPPIFEINANVNETLLINSLFNSAVLVNGKTNDINGDIHDLSFNPVTSEIEFIAKNVSSLQFPMVFVGGKIFGGLDRVMATHLSGDLVPILKQARALWL